MGKIKKIVLVVIIILIAIGLIIASVLVYFIGVNFPFVKQVITVPIFEQSPGSVLSAMQKKMVYINTAHYQCSGYLGADIKQTPWAVNFLVEFDGGLENGLMGNLDIKNEVRLQGINYLVYADAILASDESYFRFSEVPALSFMDLNSVKDNWYKYPAPFLFSQQDISISALREAISFQPIFNFIKRMPDEIFDEQLTYHYQVTADAVSAEYLTIYLPDYIRDRNISFKKLGDLVIDIWIGKSDKYLHRLQGSYNSGQLLFDFDCIISKFNQTVTMDQPNKAYSMEQFAKNLFGQTNFLDLPLFGYVVGINTKNLITDEDRDDLFIMWENWLGTDPKKADTDGDGYNDGAEVRSGYNPKGSGSLFSPL